MTTRRRSISRQLDNLGLRVQARVDAAWADRVVPYAAAVLLFAVLMAVTLATIRQLDGGSNLGVWRQAAWLVRHDLGAETSLSSNDPILDSGSFVSYPVMWATRVAPAPVVFAAVHALALSLGVIALWKICRTEVALRIGATSALVLAYSLSPALHAANLSIFRPEVVAVPALFWAYLSARRAQWLRFAPAVGLVLVCRADLGLTVAALGLLVMAEGARRVGLTTAIVGVAWTATAVVWLRPELPEGPLTAAQIAGAQSSAPLAALRSLAIDPVRVLSDVFSSPSTEVIVVLLGPLLFLPLVATRYLMPAIPAVVLGVAGSQALARLVEPGVPAPNRPGEQVVVALPFVLVAATMAFGRIGRPSITRINVDHRLVAALACGAVLFFVQSAPNSPYERPWEWGGRDMVDAAREEASDHVPDEVTVAASPQLTELLAERPVLDQLTVAPPSRASTRDFEAIALDTTGTTESGLPLWTDADRLRVLDALRAQGYRVRFRSEGIFVFTL